MIFIIDDSIADIELTTRALEATGRELVVRSATSGNSALEMLRNGLGVPDLILLDLKMHGMSGIEVLREIRADYCLRSIPVVVVTSSSLESDRTESIAAGASGYIQKPLALAQFGKSLESILSHWLPN